MGEVVFLLLLERYEFGMKLKKIAYCSSLPHFSLLSMHKVVSEAILTNTFYKIGQLHL